MFFHLPGSPLYTRICIHLERPRIWRVLDDNHHPSTKKIYIYIYFPDCCYIVAVVSHEPNNLVDSLAGGMPSLGSFRFEDEDEDEDEDEALCFRHNEIFKLFRLQLGRDDEVDCKNVVTPSLSRI